MKYLIYSLLLLSIAMAVLQSVRIVQLEKENKGQAKTIDSLMRRKNVLFEFPAGTRIYLPGGKKIDTVIASESGFFYDHTDAEAAAKKNNLP